MEIRIESVNTDNSHSWVRISHGLNKLVTDLIDKKYDDKEQETSTTKTEVFASRTVHILKKENGLVLNQELNSIKRTQWQKD